MEWSNDVLPPVKFLSLVPRCSVLAKDMYALVVVSLFGAVGSALGSVTGNAPKGTYVCHQPSSDNTTIYDFTLKDVYKNRDINFSQFQGKVTLIVNVATY